MSEQSLFPPAPTVNPAETLTAEEWRPVVGYEGYYEVSSLGRVRSLQRQVKHSRGGITNRRGKMLRLRPQKGYLFVQLAREGRVRSRGVHGLVCRAFKGPRPPGKEVAHENGKRDDNRADNLNWKTHHENERDKWLHGTVPLGIRNGKYTHPEATPSGEDHGQSKLTEEQVIMIRKVLAEGLIGAHRLAKLVGVSKTAITYIGSGRNWRHL